MTLTKAIARLTTEVELKNPLLDKDTQIALNIGISAIKRIRNDRDVYGSQRQPKLPRETVR